MIMGTAASPATYMPSRLIYSEKDMRIDALYAYIYQPGRPCQARCRRSRFYDVRRSPRASFLIEMPVAGRRQTEMTSPSEVMSLRQRLISKQHACGAGIEASRDDARGRRFTRRHFSMLL